MYVYVFLVYVFFFDKFRDLYCFPNTHTVFNNVYYFNAITRICLDVVDATACSHLQKVMNILKTVFSIIDRKSI